MEDQTTQLMVWYDRERRILPWREDPSPYHIWLSEIMLQQTRVETGKVYYLRFLEALPDIASLAAASEELYMKLWEGLGYYSRVRNLHRAAVIIMKDYGGEMPRTAAELEKLPGIGPYSAAAISSIAFGEPVVSVDGNLLRIFARMTEYGQEIKSGSARRTALQYYGQLLPQQRPGDFNQALMDLGSEVCLPNGEPVCRICPWKSFCLADRNQTQRLFPVMPKKRARRVQKRTVLLLQCGEKIAIRQRPPHGLLAKLYEFPNTEGHLAPAEAEAYVRSLGVPAEKIIKSPVRLADARHVFSHVEWIMIGYAVELAETAGQDDLIWADRHALETVYPVPSAFAAYRTVCFKEAADR